MVKDITYTSGVIAVKEKFLLKDKIYKLCEGSAQDAFRTLSESGFGKGAEASSVCDYERLLQADMCDLDVFIREYAATKAEKEYLLSPRDFHNAKSLVKAKYLNLSGESANAMLAPDGMYEAQYLREITESGAYANYGGELFKAIQQAMSLFCGENEGNGVGGAEIGRIFDKALFRHLSAACANNRFLKKTVAAKADMTNILTALRSNTPEYAALSYVEGGILKQETLEKLFDGDAERITEAFASTPYGAFVKACIEQKNDGLPMTEAERLADSFEIDALAEKKYELKNRQPFLYYVFRRRTENANVRILFVCLLAGMSGNEIKKRLRSI